MQKFGDLTTRFQRVTLIVTALVLGGCNASSRNGSMAGAQGSATAPGTVTLSWIPPTDNTNGTPITDLAGYHIHFGTAPDSLTKVIDLTGTNVTTFEVSNLSPGTYYFAISAYTAMGTESAESEVGYKTI